MRSQRGVNSLDTNPLLRGVVMLLEGPLLNMLYHLLLLDTNCLLNMHLVPMLGLYMVPMLGDDPLVGVYQEMRRRRLRRMKEQERR